MDIKVKLTDGKVELGGKFQQALAYVKVQKGRRYDPSTKTWTVPQTVAEFVDFCGFPVDIIEGTGSNRHQTGAHHTKYGNSFSRNRWEEINEYRKNEEAIFDETFDFLMDELDSE